MWWCYNSDLKLKMSLPVWNHCGFHTLIRADIAFIQACSCNDHFVKDQVLLRVMAFFFYPKFKLETVRVTKA